MNDYKVAIPLKTNSTRVINKNLRPFYGNKSLFDVKAEQLLKCVKPEDVYVSSEDAQVEKVVKKYGFNFLLRDPALTPNSAPWSYVIKDIVNSIDSYSDIMWVQVTQPLFDEFSQVIDTWEKNYQKHDSLAVVSRLRHHIIDEYGMPVNFNFGYWHKVSQELPTYYFITWACFFMKREMLSQCYYNIGRTPYLYETDAPLVDIDNMLDFEMAQILYQRVGEQNLFNSKENRGG